MTKRRAAQLIGGLIGGAAVLVVAGIVAATVVYPPEYVYRVLAWRESDAFDWQKFPSHPLRAAPEPHRLHSAPDPLVAENLARLAAVDDWNQFLRDNQTQAFLVVQDDRVVYENYFNGTERDSIVTSFSVAKSFVSTLIGLAIADGYIGSVTDPITRYLPELLERDPRFAQITIQDLLLMASGVEYKEFRPLLFNSDDPLTTYHPDQRKIALENTRIVDPPGKYFHYNKYGPQLLGMILERTTGRSVTEYLQARLWDPLGMEFDGSWSTDSLASDFEKMETGLNARAIDFAKLGVLFLNEGQWDGQQLISKEWVTEATAPYFPEAETTYYPQDWAPVNGSRYYKYMWWGIANEDGTYDFAAQGDKGQYIYVSPPKNLVIVRNGIDYGVPSREWIRLFHDYASSL